MIIIGDNLSSDIAGGLNAGITTCWFNPSRSPNTTRIQPHYEISKLKELHSILNQSKDFEVAATLSGR